MTPDQPPDNDLCAEIAEQTGLATAVVQGLCGGLAASGKQRRDRATMLELAQTWGVSFDLVQDLAGIKLADLNSIAQGITATAWMNCGVAQRTLAQVLATVNEDTVGYAKSLSQVAKMQFDMATGGQQSPTINVTQNNFGSSPDDLVRLLKEAREHERPSEERFRQALADKQAKAIEV